MISVSKVYPSPWMSPDDITRPFTLVLKAVTVEEFRLPNAGSKERKIVLAFTRTEKRLPLNKTQAKTLAKLLGEDAEQWRGSTIVLAPAVAPNRKATIALSAAAETGVPHDQHQVSSPEATQQQQPAEQAPAAAAGVACETCGAAGPDDHHTVNVVDACPDRVHQEPTMLRHIVCFEDLRQVAAAAGLDATHFQPLSPDPKDAEDPAVIPPAIRAASPAALPSLFAC